jgi:pimeloyl-ACP methyl ester carboxylesterase
VSLGHRLAQVPELGGYAFSPDGRHLARLARRGGDLTVEALAPGAAVGPERVHADDPLLSFGTELWVPSADHIWIRSGWPGCFQLLDARRSGAGWRTVPIAESGADGLRLLTCLEGSGCDLAVSTRDGESTIWRIEADPPGLRPLITLAGVISTGFWLEPGRSLAVNVSEPGHSSSGFLVDIATRSHQRRFHISDHSADVLVGCDPASRTLWVSTDYPGYRRVGVADLGGTGKVRFVAAPPGEEPSLDVVGRHGSHLVLSRRRGVRTELWLADPSDLGLSGPLGLPDGVVASLVAGAGDRLRFAFSGPTVPMACAAHVVLQDAFRLEESPELGDLDPADLVMPRVLGVEGPHGAVETLVYEPPPDRRSNMIVVALHGGPVAQWSAKFTPELQLFAGLGATVAAPNYHGSTGYGEEFIRALEKAGGSVDLDDVVAVIGAMRAGPGREGATVVLYGQSYGAYLALLLAATHPHLCDAVIAVAPFTSLASVASASHPGVRRIADLLRNPGRGDGELDLLRRCHTLSARLLIAHGSEDRTVPIAESHALCEQLRACGYRDGRNLSFLPLPGVGHAVVSPPAASRLYDRIESFLSHFSHFDEEQDVAGRRSRPCAPEPRPLCDTIPKGGDM